MAMTMTAPGPTAIGRRDASLFPTLCLLFFASGACGLIYQQLWLRQLSLVFGVTIYAVSTVLAAFFGGLALGSVLAGRWTARTNRPLHWYGVVEILVGVLAVMTASPALRCLWKRRVCRDRRGRARFGRHRMTVVRFVLSFVVLLVPATLLGATLPLVAGSRAVRGSRGR